MIDLKGNQQVLQELFTSSAEGILVVDVSGVIVLANPRCEDLFGYPVSELIGKQLEVLVPDGAKQDHARFRKYFFEHPGVRPMAKGVLLYGLHRNGNKFPIAISLSYFHLQGHLYGVAHIADMRERRKAEDERDLLFNVFHQTLNEIYIIDAHSLKFEMVNESALKNMGYTLPEIQQLTPWDIKPAYIEAHFRQLVAPLLQGKKEKIVFNAELKRKNNSTYPVRVYLQMVKYEDTKVIVQIVSDISEQQKTIEALQSSEASLQKEKERIQQYLDIASSIFLVLSKDQTVSLLNQKGCEILEITEKDAVGKNWFTHFLPEDEREQVQQVFGDIMQGKLEAVEVYENSVVTGSGKQRLIEWHNTVLKDEKGIPTGTLSSGIDITEKRATEKATMHALIEGQEAERQRIAKELHDGLGQALTAIRLNLNTLEADFDKFNEQSKEGFERVKTIAASATQDVQTISRNLMPPVLQDYGLVKALETLCKTVNDAHNVKVHLQTHRIDPSLDISIATGLYRIAQELLNNMLKYAQAEEVQVQLLGHDKSIILMVEDDGVGFEVEKVKKGLGLKNIDARIKALGGTLLIDAQPGQGTLVTVEIPWNKSQML